jgi:uncharacterized protein YerC
MRLNACAQILKSTADTSVTTVSWVRDLCTINITDQLAQSGAVGKIILNGSKRR